MPFDFIYVNKKKNKKIKKTKREKEKKKDTKHGERWSFTKVVCVKSHYEAQKRKAQKREA